MRTRSLGKRLLRQQSGQVGEKPERGEIR